MNQVPFNWDKHYATKTINYKHMKRGCKSLNTHLPPVFYGQCCQLKHNLSFRDVPTQPAPSGESFTVGDSR